MRLFRSSIVPCVAVAISCSAGNLAWGALPTVPPPDDETQTPPPSRETPPERPRSPVLSPEQSTAAWKLQATTAAKGLGVSEAQTAHTVKAYLEARESHNAETRKLRDEVGGRNRNEPEGDRADRAKRFAELQARMDEITEAHRQKLQASLRSSLSQEQTDKAMASLGTFSPRWDLMVDALTRYNLEPAKLDQALAAVEPYVIASGAIRGAADVAAARQTAADARDKMLEVVKQQGLTEQQFAEFQRAVGRPGEGRGGRGRGPGTGTRSPGDPGSKETPGRSGDEGQGSTRDE